MKILHTADWHLGARLGRFSRAEDLRRSVEQVFDYCDRESVAVLLIAGDLFHKGAFSNEVCDAIEHFKGAAAPFLRAGGTILAVTGNHDHEVFSVTLKHALDLADPSPAEFGKSWATGRFHFATRPTFCRLTGRDDQDVQFVLMPYPTPTRYFDGEATHYGPGEKNARLMEGFATTLAKIRSHARFDASLQSVLVGHVYLSGVRLSNGHQPTDAEDVVYPDADLRAGWAYVALGHVHRPQAIGGATHVRYSGSLDRISADEREDAKGVILLDIGPGGVRGEPVTLPLEATPMLDVEINDADRDFPRLQSEHAAIADRALVRCRMTHRSGQDDLDELLGRLTALFPRCYERHLIDASVPDRATGDGTVLEPGRGVRRTVLDYVKAQLEGQELAEAVVAEADRLLTEVGQ